MYDPSTDQATIVRNSQLHEDLGQVEYIFSDKVRGRKKKKDETWRAPHIAPLHG